MKGSDKSVIQGIGSRILALFVLFRWQFWGVAIVPVLIGEFNFETQRGANSFA